MSRTGIVQAFTVILAWIPALGIDCYRMKDQARYDLLEPSEFFADGLSARPLVEGTVAYESSKTDGTAHPPRVNGELVTQLPFELTRQDLRRGQEQYEIFCSVCHGRTGDGDGMIVRRGFSRPPSYHIPRLREIPVGHFYEVITNGWGAMYSYNDRVAPMDRWRIAAYIRALQLSQGVAIADLPEQDRRKVEEAAP